MQKSLNYAHILAIIYYICIGTHKVRTSSEQIYAKIITNVRDNERD